MGPKDGAKSGSASVCDSTKQVAACLYYDYFTVAPEGSSRKGHEVGLTTALPLADRVYLGVTTRYSKYTESGSAAMPDNSVSGFGTDAGLIVKVGEMVNVGAAGYNLLGSDEDQFPMGVGGGAALYLTPDLMLAGDGRWNLETDKGRFGAGAEYFLSTRGGQQGYPVRAGYVYDELSGASYMSGGLGYVTPRAALDLGARRQVSEGHETLIQFGLRLFLAD